MGRPATMFYWRGRGFATDAGGTRTLLVKGPKTKANRELALQRLALLLGKSPPRPRSDARLTVGEIIDQFLVFCAARVSAGEIKPNTLSLYYRPYCRLLKAACGSWRADEVGRARILAYRGQLAHRQLKPNTIKNHLGVLRTVLRWARSTGLISSDSHNGIPCLPRQRREKIPTAEELRALFAAARPDVRDVLVTVLNLPVRPGDCYALRRGWVDLESGLLRLQDSKTGPRLVCLVPTVAEILDQRMEVLASDDDFVFTTITGRPWTIRYFAEMVRKARWKAGLGPHVTAYTLRHAWTTQAFLNGLDLQTVRALRGDRDVRTTLTYEHLAGHLGYLQEAARRAVGLSPRGDGPRMRRDPRDEHE